MPLSAVQTSLDFVIGEMRAIGAIAIGRDGLAVFLKLADNVIAHGLVRSELIKITQRFAQNSGVFVFDLHVGQNSPDGGGRSIDRKLGIRILLASYRREVSKSA